MVVKTPDCDTVSILDATNTTHRIRLAGSDASERKQPFGKASTQHLTTNAALQVVTVEYDKRDRYGRIVGKILLNGLDLCLVQVRAGLAWHCEKYQLEQSPADRGIDLSDFPAIIPGCLNLAANTFARILNYFEALCAGHQGVRPPFLLLLLRVKRTECGKENRVGAGSNRPARRHSCIHFLCQV